jgi:signal transduction histidine kinase
MAEKTSVPFPHPLKVLIVEDNPVDRRILESMLSESSGVIALRKSADTLQGALKLLDDYEFDIVVLDLNLPDSEGEDTLVRLSSKCSQAAIVINTGAYEDEMGLHILSYGAQDFLVKGKYTAYVLNKSLHYALERKHLEIELTKAHEKLKEAQAQLIHTEKMRVVGTLASGIAHEVKNPLATILYGVTYLREQLNPDDEKLRSVLVNMKEAVERANGSVNDLLHFASTFELDRKSEDLNGVIEKSLSLIHHEIERKHIEVVKRLDQAIPAVIIDRNRIEQVLINLTLNAVHAVSEGGRLEFKTYCHALSGAPGDFLHLDKSKFKCGQTVVVCEVEDNGRGIPEGFLSKIFDPFFTTRRDRGGVGLGLSVSKTIMESHDGAIFVENGSSTGARARLVFPSEGVNL